MLISVEAEALEVAWVLQTISLADFFDVGQGTNQTIWVVLNAVRINVKIAEKLLKFNIRKLLHQLGIGLVLEEHIHSEQRHRLIWTKECRREAKAGLVVSRIEGQHYKIANS